MAKQLVYDLIAEKETQAAQFGGGGGGGGRGGRGRGGFRGDRDRGDRRDRDRDRDDFGDDRVSCLDLALRNARCAFLIIVHIKFASLYRPFSLPGFLQAVLAKSSSRLC